CLGYIFSLFKSLLTDSEITGYSKWELLKISITLTEEPEVQKEMLSNVYITLIVCSIFIVWYAIKLLKQTKKPTITKV
ncbi:MAG: hypothetical protein J5808_04530, partial [Paludibacteraceae bacterium]|nr:hypothetical protein [Paludibacteraceae bacterium]